MNNSEIRTEVSNLIILIKDGFDRFQQQESIPQAELDEVLAAVENLYRKTVVLSYVNAITESENSPAEHSEVEAIVTEAETIVFPPETEMVMENQTEVMQAQTEEHLPVAEAQVITELTEENGNMVAEKTAVTQTETVASKETSYPQKQLADIKAGIGINDKFQFVAELFEGSGEKYEESIKYLNSLESLDSSLLYLDEIRTNYRWKENSGAAERLMELIKRRFI